MKLTLVIVGISLSLLKRNLSANDIANTVVIDGRETNKGLFTYFEENLSLVETLSGLVLFCFEKNHILKN